MQNIKNIRKIFDKKIAKKDSIFHMLKIIESHKNLDSINQNSYEIL